MSRYVYPPGTYFPPHTHQVFKMDAVVSGEFRLTIGDTSLVLCAGDAIAVPRGVEHAAEVVGSKPVVSLGGIKRQS